MGTVPAKNRGFGIYISKSPFTFSGKVQKSWSRTHRSRMLTFENVDFWVCQHLSWSTFEFVNFSKVFTDPRLRNVDLWKCQFRGSVDWNKPNVNAVIPGAGNHHASRTSECHPPLPTNWVSTHSFRFIWLGGTFVPPIWRILYRCRNPGWCKSGQPGSAKGW